jgi:ketosteroid isomerase-like protein
MHTRSTQRAIGGRILLVLLLAAVSSGNALHAQDASEPLRAQLDASATAAEGVRAVKRLQYSYSHYLDAGLWDDLADLFADDAAVVSPAGEVRGRRALRQLFMQQAGRTRAGLAAGQLHTHLVMQPIITLGDDGRSAKGTWHEVAMLGRFGIAASWRGGIYENEYRFDRGVWKISRVHYFPQYSGGFDDFGHKAPAKWNIPYHFEAKHVGVTVPQAALTALAAGSAVTVPELQRRIGQLSDETAVHNLQHVFGYYLDRKLWDDVADLFTPDGTLRLAPRGTQFRGRAPILQALAKTFGPAPLRHGELFDHILLATVVTIAPDGLHAAARSTQLGMLGVNGEYAKWELGVYENQFVKQGGLWKLSAVRYFPRMSTDYDRGWAVDGKPETQPVAFHYVNPVTGQRVRNAALPAMRSGPAASAVDGGSATALQRLQKQADAALAVDAVENLNSSYGYYIDESAWDNMADTFASVGSKELTGAGVYVGTERIRKALNLRGPAGGRSANFYTIHQLVQPVIHVAGDGLSAKARLRLFQAGGNADGSSGSWIGGIYENTAVFENGEWKFGVQDLHHLFNASYRNGWARVGPSATTLAGGPLLPRASPPSCRQTARSARASTPFPRSRSPHSTM